MSRGALFCLTLFVASLVGARANACSCAGAGSPCEAVGVAASVFVGTVTSVKEGERKRKTNGELDFTPRLVRFSVGHSFTGATGAEVEVATGLGEGDCGYPFAKGLSYVVYAYRGEKDERLYTSACTRTRRVVAAAEDLRYLRGLASAPSGVNISGKVEHQLPYAGADGEWAYAPMEGALLSVEGAGQNREARTDALGRFRLTGLRPGRLKLKLQLTGEELAGYKPERLLNFESGGCASEVFYVLDNGRIEGRVLDAEGEPVSGVGVVLLGKTGWHYNWYARTDEDGRYKASSMPPGQYMVGINVRGRPLSIEPDEMPADFICPNCRVFVDMLRPEGLAEGYPRVFYPGVFRTSDAGLISVSVGQEVQDIDLRLPPCPAEGVVKGRVLRADGTPAANAQVFYREVTYEDMMIFNFSVRADERGEFSFKAYRGGRYLIEAEYVAGDGRDARMSGSSDPLTVTVTKPEEAITLVVKRPA
jgi:hypothetical protein